MTPQYRIWLKFCGQRNRRIFKGFMAYELNIGSHVFQWCHNDNWNWREYATFYRFNYFNTKGA